MSSSETCAYIVPKKRRRCKMLVKAGQIYCGEHIVHGNAEQREEGSPVRKNKERMPCPYDPNHSCYTAQLEKHLAKCNSRPKPTPPYIVKGINVVSSVEGEEIKISLTSLSDKELLSMIEKISTLHKKYVGTIEDIYGQHSVMESQLNGMKASKGSWRHLYQNSAILHNMGKAGILQRDEMELCFVEYGSGRGQLSYWVAQAADLQKSKFILIDKSSPRHKLDNKYKSAEDFDKNFERIRADIADVDIVQVPFVRQAKKVVGIGKHLCGAATDLALMSLERCSKQQEEVNHGDLASVQGICIALCCHHRCTWSLYVGKEFFNENGLSQKDFAIIKALTSWATCGARLQEASAGVEDEHVNADKEDTETQSRYSRMGLSADEREEIGRQCKQIIDYGRLVYLQGWKGDHQLRQSRLVSYVPREISLENVLLLATQTS